MSDILKPNDYLRLTRRKAGLTIAQIAARFSARPEHAATIRDALERAELPGATIRYEPLIRFVACILPFDAATYRQLRDEPADRHPRLCTGCACSSWSPCVGHDGQECTMGDGDVCTVCEARAASAGRRAAA